MLVTDQDKSMIKEIVEVFLETQHKFCRWDITENWRLRLVQCDKSLTNVHQIYDFLFFFILSGWRQICNDTDFIKNISPVIWSEHMDPVNFEKAWNDIIHS